MAALNITIQNSDGDTKATVSGILALAGQGGLMVEPSGNGVTLSYAKAPQTDSSGYSELYSSIINKTGAFSSMRQWISSVSGSSGVEGGLQLLGGRCMAVGRPEEDSDKITDKIAMTREIADICPPCVDCNTFRSGEGSPMMVDANGQDVRIDGVYDLIEALRGGIDSQRDLILNRGALLDMYKRTVGMFNHVVHSRSLIFHAETIGRRVHASYKYTNYTKNTVDYKIRIIFANAPSYSRAVFLDASHSPSGGEVKYEDESNDGEFKHSETPTVVINGTLKSQASCKAHVACAMPYTREKVDKDSAKVKFIYECRQGLGTRELVLTPNRPYDSIRPWYVSSKPIWWDSSI